MKKGVILFGLCSIVFTQNLDYDVKNGRDELMEIDITKEYSIK